MSDAIACTTRRGAHADVRRDQAGDPLPPLDDGEAGEAARGRPGLRRPRQAGPLLVGLVPRLDAEHPDRAGRLHEHGAHGACMTPA
eukprot:scaffold69790_cov58-Phaeocystis_antarctica.AAC.6